MTETTLSDFSSSQQKTPPENQQNNSKQINEENTDQTAQRIEAPTTNEFKETPSDYPTTTIKELANSTETGKLQTTDCVVSPTFASVAGEGHMGSPSPIENKQSVLKVLQRLTDLPVVLTGGGMGTPMGAGAVYGKLTKVTECENTVKVHVEELYRISGRNRDRTHKSKIGSYCISVPITKNDCRATIKALSEYAQNKTEYLDPAKKEKKDKINRYLKTFDDLEPGDKITIPTYTTRLDVVSKPYKTHVSIPRTNGEDRKREVTSIVVNNPNGGFYQLGLSTSTSIKSNQSLTCYVSSSKSTAVTPNTTFTRDTKFNIADAEIKKIPNPVDPTVINPDEEILNSPLPEPRLQKNMNDISGVGQKTTRRLFKITENRHSAHTIAHSIFNDENLHPKSLDEIMDVIDSLPSSEQVYEQLKSIAENIEK